MNNTETKAKGLAVLVIMTALCALVASASAPPTPFIIYGYVSYENGGACNNPTVNINNTNTSNSWSTEIKTNASYNYYQLMLANGTDVNASEILRFNVTSPNGNQSNITEHTVTQENITDGGLFNFNITLEAPVHDVYIKSDYTGAHGTGIRIDNATTLKIPLNQNLTIGNAYYIKYKVENNGTAGIETVNITVKISNETGWSEEIANYSQDITNYHLGNVTWDTLGLTHGNYNITVNATITGFADAHPKDNERMRQVTLEEAVPPCEPAIEVNKTVWNGTAWVEMITDAEINNTYKFRCEVHNNGTCCDLTDISVVDNLSDSMEYANNATVDGVPREPDWVEGNKFGWDFPGSLLPCETIVIEFDATVIDCGNDSNVQNATAYCPETEGWVSDEDDAWINVPDGTICGYGGWEPDPVNQCQERRQIHRCIGGECTPTDDYEYQPANEGEICGYGDWEDVEENPCQEMREIHRCVEGQCTPSGEYETRPKAEGEICGYGDWEQDPANPCQERRQIHRCIGGECTPTDDYEYQPANEGEICGYGDWEQDPANECQERREIHTCLGGQCTLSGEYEHRAGNEGEICGYGDWEDDLENQCQEMREIHKCVGGSCTPSGEYEYQNKIIPDLVITEKYETLEDGNFTVNYTIKNIGGGDADASNTTIYINGSNTIEDPVPALASGENYTHTVGPFECLCDGTLNITVCADNGNAVNECNETNNCKVNIVECPPCPKPDLNITHKYETLEDGNFTVNYTVKNIGAVDAGVSNTTIYVDGVNVSEDPVPALTAGAKYTNTVGPFQCPCSQTLNITLCADNGDVVNESNETNNCMINEFACPPCPKPDLNITDKFETLIDGGKNFTVNYTVKNIGAGDAGASNTTIYINSVNVLEDPVPALPPVANYTNEVGPFECPCSVILNITVCADNGNVVNESDETNNCMINELECPDTTPPEVFDYAPTGTNVPVTTNITAAFSEAVNESTLNNETIIVRNSLGIREDGIITYDSDNFTVTFDPLSNLEYSETYNVTITTGVQDLAGNNMSSDFTWNFTTWEPDLVISGQWVNWPGNCTICYNITNIGNGTVLAGHNTTLYVDGNEPAHDEVPVNLAPNESYIGCFNYIWTFTPPQDNITICADNNKTVHEGNESNNCLTKIYKCGDASGDGYINMFDVGVLWQDAYRTPTNGWAEDVDCNGYVTIWDMSLVWQVVAERESPINCCCMED